MTAYGGYFRLAQTVGKQLHEIFDWPGPITHRQYLAWMYWLEEEWNQPSRSDHYLMQLGCEVRSFRNSFAKGSRRVKMDDFKLQFKTRGSRRQPSRLSVEQATAYSKAKWFAAVGGRKKIRGLPSSTPSTNGDSEEIES